jgi:hypothetical protein
MTGVSFLVRAKFFFPQYQGQLWTLPASYLIGTRGFLPQDKADHSFPFSAKGNKKIMTLEEKIGVLDKLMRKVSHLFEGILISMNLQDY